MKKNLILSLLLSFCGLISQAGNEGPQAAPIGPGDSPQLLAEISISAGLFRPPNAPTRRQYQVMVSGEVQLIETYFEDSILREEVTQLEPLPVTQLEQIQNLVAQIQPGDFLPRDPSQVGCMDAPSILQTVFQNSVAIPISQKFDCLYSPRENATDVDQQLIEILEQVVSSR